MLDIKRIREDFEGVKKAVEFRGKGDFGLDNVKKYDEERRALLAEVEAMKNRQNTVSREIPKMKKEGQDTSEIMAEMRELSKAIKEMDGRLSEIEENLKIALLGVPNTPYKEVQYGEDDSANEIYEEVLHRVVEPDVQETAQSQRHLPIAGDQDDVLYALHGYGDVAVCRVEADGGYLVHDGVLLHVEQKQPVGRELYELPEDAYGHGKAEGGYGQIAGRELYLYIVAAVEQIHERKAHGGAEKAGRGVQDSVPVGILELLHR